MTQNAYFSLIAHTKQLLLVTFCDTTAEMEFIFGQTDGQRTDGRRTDGGRTEEGQTDVEVEIVI